MVAAAIDAALDRCDKRTDQLLRAPDVTRHCLQRERQEDAEFE